MVIIAAFLAGVAVFGIVLSLGMPTSSLALWRLASIEAGAADQAPLPPKDAPFADRIVGPALDRLSETFSKTYPRRWRQRIQTRLDRAGMNVEHWSRVAVMQAGLGGGFGLLLLVSSPVSGGMQFLLPLVAGGVAFMLPDMYISRQMKSRSAAIERSLADAVDILVVCMEAGLGFDAAMSKLVEKSRGPLTQEFARALHGMWKGQSRREALLGIIERTDVTELHSVLHAVIQADRTGAPLAATLRGQTEQLRVRLRQRAEETAMKAPVKIVFPLVFLIFPALFAVILAPAAISFFES